MVTAQSVPSDQTITWIGALSGGAPVAALAIVGLWFLWRRLNQALATIEQIQKERLDDVREMAPMLRDTGSALVRATVMLERQVSSNQAGGGR